MWKLCWVLAVSASSSLDLVLMSIGQLVAAIQGDRVSALDAPDSVPTVDLFQVLAQPPPSGARRRVRVAAEPPWDLLVGAHVRVERKESTDFQPVPTYLEVILNTVGVTGLVTVEQGFALLIDADVLAPEGGQ